MYKHPDIYHTPQHPHLKNYTTCSACLAGKDESFEHSAACKKTKNMLNQQQGYTIEETGVFSSLANAAKSAANAAASAAGYALRKDVGRKLGRRWLNYYKRARALDNGMIAQNLQEKVKREVKAKLKELKEATGGKTLSYDDAQWCASDDNPKD